MIEHSLQEMLDAVERNPYSNSEDKARHRNSVMHYIMFRKQNELDQVKNSIASKFIKWSLIKVQFISEVTRYSSDITSKVNTGEITTETAIKLLDKELSDLRNQDEEMTRKRVKQAVIIKASVKKNNDVKRREIVSLTIAGVGFVTAGLQIVAGVGMVGSVAGTIPGALLIAHGTNNIIENGYYILYRESYTGPLKFLYEGVGAQFGLSKSDADVMYTAVDIALSINGIMSYKLAEDVTRLYRYVNADLLWGLKSMGIKNMTTAEILLEIFGDINTAISQVRNY
ncbi:putative inner membrane protein [Yersinia wautersii]|uniref:Inner membrane protein n=1 Tax=Yersinia wautersii TaxID=1341643 RepID=A0ABM9TIU6_9GAMM|nr:putative inner membrane protein [Yersinia wautersii]